MHSSTHRLRSQPGFILVRIALVLVAILGMPVSSAMAQGAPRQAAPVTFEPRELDLGYAGFGKDLVGEVKLRNNSRVPLKVLRTRADCNCTIPSISQEMIMPGEAVTLTVKVETGWIPGPVKKHVYVQIDGYRQPATLPVKAELSYDINVDPPSIARDGNLEGELSVHSVDGQAFRVLSVGGRPPVHIDVDSAEGSSRQEHRIRWTLPEHDIPVFLIVETDHPTAPVVEVRVLHPDIREEQAQMRRDNPAAPVINNLNFGHLRPGEWQQFRLEFQRIKWGQPIEVIDDFKHIEARITDRRKADGDWTSIMLEVRAREGAPEGVVLEPVLIESGENVGRMWVIGRISNGN